MDRERGSRSAAVTVPLSGAASQRTPAAVERGDPLIGTAYRTIRRIGAGAMGEVFEAEHTSLRKRVAVKVLSPSLVRDASLVDRLRLEAQALARVRHPNVVAVHDHAVTPAGVPFLVMDLLHGRSLHEVLKERGALSLAEATPILEQVLAGLGAIHAAGLTHRDLKPANVFLSEEAGGTVVKLLDLGIVKVHGAPELSPLRFPTKEGHVVGTPRCMAPEQVMGRACDERTDLYAVGVLMFLLLAGRDPFHRLRTNLEVMAAHVTEAPPALSKVAVQPLPAELDAVAARALAKDPAARFASAAEMRGALLAVVGPSASEAEKGGARTFRKTPTGTVPIDPALFRAPAAPLPFRPVPGDVPRRAPAFGLPEAISVHPTRESPRVAPQSNGERSLVSKLLPWLVVGFAAVCGLIGVWHWRGH